ncbi:hypothetical protein OC835_003932 [Tilletia horrida]|nr:hypothetical protein OC835_003932 [Tilletia horrida]
MASTGTTATAALGAATRRRIARARADTGVGAVAIVGVGAGLCAPGPSRRCVASTSRRRSEDAAPAAHSSSSLSSSSSSSAAGAAAEPHVMPPLVAPSSASPRPLQRTGSRFVHLTNLPNGARSSDIYRLSYSASSQRVGDMHALTFLRTPSLYPMGEAVANFNSDSSAKRFQRAVDGVSMSGRHVRASLIPPAQASQLLASSTSANLSAQLIHFLVSQNSGSNVLLRGLPPNLFVSRLHEVLQKGYSLAPTTEIRPGRRTAHLDSLFEAVRPIVHRARNERMERNEELYRLIKRKNKHGLPELLAQLEQAAAADEQYAEHDGDIDVDVTDADAGESPSSPPSSTFTAGAHTDADDEPHIASSPFAPSHIDGIEGPDLRLDSHSENADNPYAYNNYAKVFWDVIWAAARNGQPYPSRSAARRGGHGGDQDRGRERDRDQRDAGVPKFIPYLPIIKLPYPAAHGTDGSNLRAWFVVRMTDAADAHRLVRRWHNMYYSEREFGQRYLVEASVLH